MVCTYLHALQSEGVATMDTNNSHHSPLSETGVVPDEIIFKNHKILHNDIAHNFHHWLKKITSNADILANQQPDSQIEDLACDILDYCLELRSFFEITIGLKYNDR